MTSLQTFLQRGLNYSFLSRYFFLPQHSVVGYCQNHFVILNHPKLAFQLNCRLLLLVASIIIMDLSLAQLIKLQCSQNIFRVAFELLYPYNFTR